MRVAKVYLERLVALMQRAAPGSMQGVSLEYKHFFSGAAVYANNRICLSLTPAGVAIKLPQAARDTLIKKAGAKPLRYFAKGPVKKDYVVLPKDILDDTKALRRWIKVSVKYTISLPMPSRKKIK